MDDADRRGEGETRDYELVMRPEIYSKRDYIVGRFPDGSLPDLAGCLSARMFRVGEETRARRVDARRRAVKEDADSRTTVGRSRARVRPMVPSRVRKKWKLEVEGGALNHNAMSDAHGGGVPAPGGLAGADAGGAGGAGNAAGAHGLAVHAHRYTGTFEGSQKSAYAYFVLNDDDTVEVIPLPKHAWYSFRGRTVVREESEADAMADDVTRSIEEAEKYMNKQEKMGEKLLKKLTERYERDIEAKPDVYGHFSASRTEKKAVAAIKREQRETKDDDSGADMDFETTYDDDDVDAGVEEEKDDQDEDKPGQKRKESKGSPPPSPPPSNNPGSPEPGSGSDSEEDGQPRLDRSGREMLKLLKQEEKGLALGESRSPMSRSPSPSSVDGRKRANGSERGEPTGDAMGEGSTPKKPRLNKTATKPVAPSSVTSSLPGPGEPITEEHIRGVIRNAEENRHLLTMQELLACFKSHMRDKAAREHIIALIRMVVVVRVQEGTKFVVLRT